MADRQEIVYDQQRRWVANHHDWEEIYLTVEYDLQKVMKRYFQPRLVHPIKQRATAAAIMNNIN